MSFQRRNDTNDWSTSMTRTRSFVFKFKYQLQLSTLPVNICDVIVCSFHITSTAWVIIKTISLCGHKLVFFCTSTLRGRNWCFSVPTLCQAHFQAVSLQLSLHQSHIDQQVYLTELQSNWTVNKQPFMNLILMSDNIYQPWLSLQHCSKRSCTRPLAR